MTAKTRDELMQVLGELREALPEMRFGQLICNLATVARGPEPEAAWDIEDEELLDVARQQLEALRERSILRG